MKQSGSSDFIYPCKETCFLSKIIVDIPRNLLNSSVKYYETKLQICHSEEYFKK